MYSHAIRVQGACRVHISIVRFNGGFESEWFSWKFSFCFANDVKITTIHDIKSKIAKLSSTLNKMQYWMELGRIHKNENYQRRSERKQRQRDRGRRVKVCMCRCVHKVCGCASRTSVLTCSASAGRIACECMCVCACVVQVRVPQLLSLLRCIILPNGFQCNFIGQKSCTVCWERTRCTRPKTTP